MFKYNVLAKCNDNDFYCYQIKPNKSKSAKKRTLCKVKKDITSVHNSLTTITKIQTSYVNSHKTHKNYFKNKELKVSNLFSAPHQ